MGIRHRQACGYLLFHILGQQGICTPFLHSVVNNRLACLLHRIRYLSVSQNEGGALLGGNNPEHSGGFTELQQGILSVLSIFSCKFMRNQITRSDLCKGCEEVSHVLHVSALNWQNTMSHGHGYAK